MDDIIDRYRREVILDGLKLQQPIASVSATPTYHMIRHVTLSRYII